MEGIQGENHNFVVELGMINRLRNIPLLLTKAAVRNYQGGRVANNRGRVMVSCALKKVGLQFIRLSLRGGHNLSYHNLI